MTDLAVFSVFDIELLQGILYLYFS